MSDLSIELSLGGLMPALGGLDKVSARLEKIGQQLDGLKMSNIQLNLGGSAGGKSTARAKPPVVPPLPPEPKPLLDRLGEVLSSSRLSLGGKGGPQLMPLIGQTIKALGPEIGAAFGPGAVEALGPLAAGVGVAVQGMKVLFGSRAGAMNPLGGTPFGKVDTATDTLKLIKYIGDTKTPFNDAAMAAREFGLQFALMDRLLDRSTLKLRDDQAALSAWVNDPKTLKAAGEFNVKLDYLKGNLLSLSTVIGGELMQDLGPFVQILGDGVRSLTVVLKLGAEVNDFIAGPMRGLLQILIDLNRFDLAGAQSDLAKLLHGDFMKGPASDLNEAANNLLQATKQGTFGGGERARGAVPGAWNGVNMNFSWGTRDAANMGAFGGG